MRRYAYLVMLGCGIFPPAEASAVAPRSFSLYRPDINAQDSAKLIAADHAGDLFLVFSSAISSKTTNIHVVKTDSSGNVLGALDFGGSGVDTPYAAAVDSQGNLIIAGGTLSPDFPLVSPLQIQGSIFVARLDGHLNGVQFSTLLGGAAGGYATSVALDLGDNIYVTGVTGSGFLTTAGALQTQAPGTPELATVSNGFVTEISASGASLVFSTYFSGNGFVCGLCSGPHGPLVQNIFTTPSGIAVGPTGAVVIGGFSNANNLPVSGSGYAPQCNCTSGDPAGFVAKIAPGGGQLVWGTYLPVPNGVPGQFPSVTGLTLDAAGNVILTGLAGTGLPATAGALQSSFPLAPGQQFGSDYAGFLAKFDSSGSHLVFATYFGGSTELVSASAGPVAVDQSGTIWLTGTSAVEELPTTAVGMVLGTNYLAGVSPDGTSLTAFFTSPGGGAGTGLTISPNGTIALLGSTGSLLISSPAPAPSIMGLAGSPSAQTAEAICARELVSIYGIDIGPSAEVAAQVTDNVISTALGGVQVLFDGTPAALLYAGPGQINAIAPSSVAGQTTTRVQVLTASGLIGGPEFTVQPAVPQVFNDATGYAVAMNQDGSANGSANRAQPGSILTIWITGAGGLQSSPDNLVNTGGGPNVFPISVLTGVTGGGFAPLEVLYAGDAPGLASGVTQINFRLPPTAEANGYPLMVQVGNATTRFLANVID